MKAFVKMFYDGYVEWVTADFWDQLRMFVRFNLAAWLSFSVAVAIAAISSGLFPSQPAIVVFFTKVLIVVGFIWSAYHIWRWAAWTKDLWRGDGQQTKR